MVYQHIRSSSCLDNIVTYNPQKENTINGIRKRSGAVTAFNKDEISNYMFGILTTEFGNEITNSIKIYQNRLLTNNCIGDGYDK